MFLASTKGTTIGQVQTTLDFISFPLPYFSFFLLFSLLFFAPIAASDKGGRMTHRLDNNDTMIQSIMGNTFEGILLALSNLVGNGSLILLVLGAF